MFPACAGMNRSPEAEPTADSNVPRVRGDEPLALLDIGGGIDVPRVRGDEPLFTQLNNQCGVMFPACAGMNRVLALTRMRGD